MDNTLLYNDALHLLQQMIATPSFSRQEQQVAELITQFLQQRQVAVQRLANNVYAYNLHFDAAKPSLLLNSHHDTVKPNPGYTRNPFEATIADGKLYGLGSNDAGGCLVSLIAAFLHFYQRPGLPVNIILAATAEEEISGTQGVELLLPHLPPIHGAMVGEPTLLQMAVAERGLMVLDAVAPGVAGHAARNEGVNALYNALEDIEKIRTFNWHKISPLLGPSRATVTVIETQNKQHNVVPATCSFVVDVRLNELYSFEEAVSSLQAGLKSTLTPRSMRLRSTLIPAEHPLVQAGLQLGSTCYGSPTTSDKALMPFAAFKLGPADSAGSHTADEFIYLHEIEQGIATYIMLIENYMTRMQDAPAATYQTSQYETLG